MVLFRGWLNHQPDSDCAFWTTVSRFWVQWLYHLHNRIETQVHQNWELSFSLFFSGIILIRSGACVCQRGFVGDTTITDVGQIHNDPKTNGRWPIPESDQPIWDSNESNILSHSHEMFMENTGTHIFGTWIWVTSSWDSAVATSCIAA